MLSIVFNKLYAICVQVQYKIALQCIDNTIIYCLQLFIQKSLKIFVYLKTFFMLSLHMLIQQIQTQKMRKYILSIFREVSSRLIIYDIT